MEILKQSIEWASAEVFSARFFILFGIAFLAASIGFWQLGKTEISKSFIVPTLVAGILILAVGVGIYYANNSRVTSFSTAYNADKLEFVKSEITRTNKSMQEYNIIVFKIIPSIIILASIVIIFVDRPIWRAVAITTIAMMIVILLIDSNANARIEEYNSQLISAAKQMQL